MTQAIMQAAVGVFEAAVQAISGAASPKRNNGAAVAGSKSARTSGPSLKQPTFNFRAQYKYNELLNFKMEVKVR